MSRCQRPQYLLSNICRECAERSDRTPDLIAVCLHFTDDQRCVDLGVYRRGSDVYIICRADKGVQVQNKNYTRM